MRWAKDNCPNSSWRPARSTDGPRDRAEPRAGVSWRRTAPMPLGLGAAHERSDRPADRSSGPRRHGRPPPDLIQTAINLADSLDSAVPAKKLDRNLIIGRATCATADA